MKVKKLALCLAALLGATTLAACTDDDKRITFNNYWQYDALSGGATVNETLTYAVTFEEGAGIDSLGYELSYGEGEYVATLKNGADPTLYTYETTLTIPVTFGFDGKSETFTDKITTTLSFMDAGNALRPISSKKTVVSHTPASSKPSSLEGSYGAYDYVIETTYNSTEGKGYSVITNNTREDKPSQTTPKFNYTSGDYSYLDNEQILLALRAVSSTTTSGTVKVYNPFLENTQRVKFSFQEKTGGDFTHTLNGAALTNKSISYRPVTLVLDEKNPGATQTAWIATADSPDKNTNRNVMLYLETPLSYSIGTLKYTLRSVQNV